MMKSVAAVLLLAACTQAFTAGPSNYMPCTSNPPHLRYQQDVDLARLTGVWYAVAETLPLQANQTKTQLQGNITQYLGCIKSTVNSPNLSTRSISGQSVVTYRQPVNGASQGVYKYNETAVLAGDNGKFKADVQFNGTTTTMDIWILKTNYRDYLMWYTCAEVPQTDGTTKPTTMWGINRRTAQKYNAFQKLYFYGRALYAGASTPNPLIDIPVDQCSM